MRIAGRINRLETTLGLRGACKVCGGRMSIVIDGGFRHGTDIIKGLALGATIVAVGRPYMWGLAHGGAEGAAAISKLLEAELRVDMALAGQTSVRGLTRDAVDYVDY